MRRVGVERAAMFLAAAVLGTIPAVGGYSNTVPEGGDFTTVGIVTQVEGGAFMLSSAALARGASKAETVAPGRGMLAGDRLWVEAHSLVRVVDTEGGRMTIAGPASVEFVRKSRGYAAVRIFKGSVKFHAAEGSTMKFENTLVDGTVDGEGAVWASDRLVQILGLTGDVKAWHPQLSQAVVLVVPGYFSESSDRFRHLQPSRPLRADEARFQTFLSRFEEGERALPAFEQAAPAPERNLASAVPAERGTRSRAELVETPRPDTARRIRAHIMGGDLNELEPEKPLVPPSPRFNAFGRHVDSKRKPSFEMKVDQEDSGQERQE